MNHWPVQDAKARFSELLDVCVNEGPQVVTRRDTETAVLVPIAEWNRVRESARPTLKALLLSDAGRAGLGLRKPRPHGGVLAWPQGVADAGLRLSAVTLGEIQAGIELPREQDPAKAAEIEAWADQVEATYGVLPMDAAVFRVWAKLMHQHTDTVYEDAMIAATAQVHHLTVVTRNVRDFKRFRVPVFNPFVG